MLAYTRHRHIIIFCQVHYVNSLLTDLFDVVYNRIGIKLIRMLRRCIIKVMY